MLTIISAPLLGKLSDRIGRRWVIVWQAVVWTLPMAALYLSTNLWIFYALYAAAGLSGSLYGVILGYR